MQHSQNVFLRNSLELATSLLGASRLRRENLLAFRKFFAESHSIFLVPLPMNVSG